MSFEPRLSVFFFVRNCRTIKRCGKKNRAKERSKKADRLDRKRERARKRAERADKLARKEDKKAEKADKPAKSIFGSNSVFRTLSFFSL